MLSTRVLGIGMLILVVGVVCAMSQNPIAVQAGYLAIVLGAVVMILGFVSLAGGEFGKPDNIHSGDSAVFTVGLIRCMIAISIADGHLDDAEIEEIGKIYKHLTKTTISADVIRKAAAEMQASGAKIEDELANISPILNKELKRKIIIASLYILAADGEMDEGELIMLDDIRLGLAMPLAQVEKMKDEFLAKRHLA